MTKQRTLSIIKPDATRRNLVGKILSKMEENGLRIIAQKRLKLSPEQAAAFYDVHKERSFFADLCRFMTADPVVVQVLEGNDAVVAYRELMGATNPINAQDGTIRKEFGISIDENSVHGSDSVENADKEIRFFFSDVEITG